MKKLALLQEVAASCVNLIATLNPMIGEIARQSTGYLSYCTVFGYPSEIMVAPKSDVLRRDIACKHASLLPVSLDKQPAQTSSIFSTTA